MPYATQQDLIDRYGAEELVQLTDRAEPPVGEIDDTVVAKALADAENLIDGHLLAGNYALPLGDVPELVRRLACDAARYYLHKDAPTDTVKSNFEFALKQLAAISAGRIKLPIAGAPAPSTGTDVDMDSRTPVFTQDALRDY